MELWLVRHGTTRANLEGRLQGTLPFSLGPEGRREAACLGRRLKGQAFLHIFCSNNPRARQTAQLLSTVITAPPPIFTPLLQEYNWGIVQGLTRREIGLRYPDVLRELERDFNRANIPGAEGINNLFRRAARFYRVLAMLEQRAKEKNLPLLVISHGKFLQAFIQYFLACDCRQGWPFSVSPASLTIMEGDFRERRRLRLFNDTCHLHRAGVQPPDGAKSTKSERVNQNEPVL